MTGALYYPRADRTTQWFGDKYPGATMPVLEKQVWHTTETTGWPGYDGGAKAPTWTYHKGLRKWRQHFRANQSARALRDPSGTPVRENRDGVVQVEICWYASRIRELTDENLNDLAHFSAWLYEEHGVRLVPARLWYPFPQSAAQDAAQRMSSAEFDAFKGHCAHMHVSGNTHGDTGALAIAEVLNKATKLVSAPIPSPAHWVTPKDKAGRAAMSYGALIWAASNRDAYGPEDGWWPQYRHQAMATLKALNVIPDDAPDTQFPEAWKALEVAINRATTDSVPDPVSFEYFVDRAGYWPMDGSASCGGYQNDWPASARDR